MESLVPWTPGTVPKSTHTATWEAQVERGGMSLLLCSFHSELSGYGFVPRDAQSVDCGFRKAPEARSVCAVLGDASCPGALS